MIVTICSFDCVSFMGLMAMGVNAEAKVVRGYVTDRNGKPVQGVKMMVVNEDLPGRKYIASHQRTQTDSFPCRCLIIWTRLRS